MRKFKDFSDFIRNASSRERKKVYASVLKRATERQTAIAAQMNIRPILMPGAETEWGTIEAVGVTGGERHYWMAGKDGAVSMIPAFMVEPSTK